ncbi:MAG TPA: urea ABC transporter permease subunit UrtB [Burkholderiales bacterium]|nr:urea ABC transporter permease subunit UrtB [Burkholderiales bacterium]
MTAFLAAVRRAAAAIALAAFALPALAALDANAVRKLGADDTDDKLAGIATLAESADPAAFAVLTALADDSLAVLKDGRVVIVAGTEARDAATGAPVTAGAADREAITINNRVRRALADALAVLSLVSPDRAVRLASARSLQKEASPDLLPLILKAADRETDDEIRQLLVVAAAALQLQDPDAKARLAAVKRLAGSDSPDIKLVLSTMLEKKPDGSFNEPDADVRAEIATSLRAIESRLGRLEVVGNVFSGLSLGSVLLLAALGLAITFGLMGIINMAHGEFLMIGAYATYVVQNLFRALAPRALDWYLAAAIPVAFLVAALVGVVLERSVIRWLYGRPLETLLATWGISLLLIQTVRTLFGAQNVEVANPSWMSGGIALAGGLVLPYNRIAIILFAALVLAAVWLVLNRTRLGLFVRTVTQNRAMADCVGVPTGRVDMLTFALGCGIAGLGGVALSQIGNVGPDLGQSYIVDSFMVVVLGGVGQLAGTVIAAIGLGEVNKFLEPFAGAVLAKIAVLVFIIVFIQKRPQGLFALKGRSAEA